MRLARGTPAWLGWLWLLPAAPRKASGRLFFLFVAAAATWFFRDPPRRPAGPGLLAAADGSVSQVQERGDGRWVVSTYLNLADVHVTRAPCDGTVLSQTHLRGKHRPAFRTSSRANERLDWLIATPRGELELTQFAGTLARRIVPYLAIGDTMRRGDRIGLIRFGSRVDLALPAGVRPAVSVRDRVRAGATTIEAVESP
jgi:phosphatidylserine decarboxylase